MSEEATNNATERVDDYIMCPCCKKLTLKKPLDLSNQLTDAWVACLVSGVPFNHTYKLYGNRVEANVRVIASALSAKIRQALAVLDGLDRLSCWDNGIQRPVDFGVLKTLIPVACSIVELRINGTPENRSYFPARVAEAAVDTLIGLYSSTMEHKDETGAGLPPSDECIEALKKVQSELTSEQLMSALPLSVLVTLSSTHANLNILMSDAGFGAGFWEGIELA